MPDISSSGQRNKIVKLIATVSIIISIMAVILAILAIIWARDNAQKIETLQEAQSTPNVSSEAPMEPSNPNVTGGSSGVGTGDSNDASIETPSPAGGVDTDGDQVQ